MWQFVVWVGLQLVSAFLLRPKTSAAVPAPGEVSGPTVDAASPVPVLFGTRRISAPNCCWYGDIATTPITRCGGGKK
ncbi:MAG: hypothetical protein ACOX5Z_00250 [Desulfobulbus sp.]|jgi:hypothetical protein